MRTDKVYLVGFMGAGKSTVARALATQLDWQVADLDVMVERRLRQSVTEIFARHGEAYFRQVEQSVLRELIPTRHVVVATGGGTFLGAANRGLITADGASIWLDVSFDTVIQRVPRDGRRPLAGDLTTMRDLWASRRAAYAQAHIRLTVDGVPVGEVVERILERLGLS